MLTMRNNSLFFPQLVIYLISNNGELNNNVFSMDDHDEENGRIFTIKEKRNLCLKYMS